MNQVDYDPGRPLAFLHIPKTAGTSLDKAFVQALAPRSEGRFFGEILLGDIDLSSIDPGLRQHIAVRQSDSCGDLSYICSHASYNEFRSHAPDAQIVTFLREPSCRLISLWMFLRGFSSEALAPWGNYGRKLELAKGPLAPFLADRASASHIDNVVTRMLLGIHPKIPRGDFIPSKDDDELFEEALGVLDKIAFVGVIEDSLMASRLSGWLGRDLILKRENVTKVHSTTAFRLSAELTQHAIDLLESHSRIDLRLWRYAMNSSPGAAISREIVLMRSMARFAETSAAGNTTE